MNGAKGCAMTSSQHDQIFDQTLIEAALNLAETHGWQHVTLVNAARDAGLPLQDVRLRFPFKAMILLRLSRQLDAAALTDEPYGNSPQERLFDLFMKRFDAMQEYRAGICTILQSLPKDPALAAFLAATTMESLRWMADSASLDRNGLGGLIRLNALLAVWSKTLLSWQKDTSPDLSETMQTLDHALTRANRMGFLKESATAPHMDIPASQTGGLPDHIADDTH